LGSESFGKNYPLKNKLTWGNGADKYFFSEGFVVYEGNEYRSCSIHEISKEKFI
jgi:hypothetical protein